MEREWWCSWGWGGEGTLRFFQPLIHHLSPSGRKEDSHRVDRWAEGGRFWQEGRLGTSTEVRRVWAKEGAWKHGEECGDRWAGEGGGCRGLRVWPSPLRVASLSAPDLKLSGRGVPSPSPSPRGRPRCSPLVGIPSHVGLGLGVLSAKRPWCGPCRPTGSL